MGVLVVRGAEEGTTTDRTAVEWADDLRGLRPPAARHGRSPIVTHMVA